MGQCPKREVAATEKLPSLAFCHVTKQEEGLTRNWTDASTSCKDKPFFPKKWLNVVFCDSNRTQMKTPLTEAAAQYWEYQKHGGKQKTNVHSTSWANWCVNGICHIKTGSLCAISSNEEGEDPLSLSREGHENRLYLLSVASYQSTEEGMSFGVQPPSVPGSSPQGEASPDQLQGAQKSMWH